jgi:hypothetical protein
MGSGAREVDHPTPWNPSVSDEPSAYQAWRCWLDRFAVGKDDPYTGLPPMTSMSGAVVLQRLAGHSHDALQLRMDHWSGRWKHDLDSATSERSRNNLDSLEGVLVRARSSLVPIVRFSRSDLLRDDLRAVLAKAVEDAIVNMQEGLEASAREGGRANESLLQIVLRVRLTSVLREEAPPAVEVEQGGVSRRRIIFTSQGVTG